MACWIIEAFFVNAERVGERTNFQQPTQITARACQTRDLQAEHGPNVPQADFRHEIVKASATNGRGTRLPLILIHHLDAGGRPSQILSPLHQIILPGRTAAIFADLKKRRLPDIDDGETIKMVRTDFLGWLSAEHRRPPLPCRHWRDGPRQHSTRTEPGNQPYTCPEHQKS